MSWPFRCGRLTLFTPPHFLVADWLPEWTRWLARGGLQMTKTSE